MHILCCSSTVYKIDANSRLVLYQKLPTKGATSISTFTSAKPATGGSAVNATYLVMANSRDNAGNIKQDVLIYGWHNITEQFEPVQEIPVADVQKVHAFESHLLDGSTRGM